jgi:head-tail adaptor
MPLPSSAFVHPRMIAMLYPSYPTTGTIQQAVEVRDAAGQPIKTWVDLTGHVGIACRVQTTGGNEIKGVSQIYATATHLIYLAGYYPLIDPKMRFVDAAGTIYDILAPNQDSFCAFTLRIVEVRY